MPDPTTEDIVRTLIGDTDSSDYLLDATEISTIIGQRELVSNGGTTVNTVAAAADAAAAIAAKLGRDYDFSEDGQSFSRSQRVGHYLELEHNLRKRAGGVSAPLRLAGTEIAATT